MILPGAKVALAALGIVTAGSVAVASPSIYKHFKDQSNKEEKTVTNTAKIQQSDAPQNKPDNQSSDGQPQQQQSSSVSVKETTSLPEGSSNKTPTPSSGDSGTEGS